MLTEYIWVMNGGREVLRPTNFDALKSRVESLMNVSGFSPPLSVVMRLGLPPLAEVMKMSSEPSRLLTNTICLPSGVHTGTPSYALLVVICVASPPFEGTVNMSPLYVKAIVEPSGDMAASRSHLAFSEAVAPAADVARIRAGSSRRYCFFIAYVMRYYGLDWVNMILDAKKWHLLHFLL